MCAHVCVCGDACAHALLSPCIHFSLTARATNLVPACAVFGLQLSPRHSVNKLAGQKRAWYLLVGLLHKLSAVNEVVFKLLPVWKCESCCLLLPVFKLSGSLCRRPTVWPCQLNSAACVQTYGTFCLRATVCGICENHPF